jgi:hypothetical protein
VVTVTAGGFGKVSMVPTALRSWYIRRVSIVTQRITTTESRRECAGQSQEMSMASTDTTKQRAAWLHTLKKLAPNYFLTFNFGYEVRAINMDRPIRTFFNAAQRECYGRDWVSQFDRDWPVAIGFLENPNTNPHYHVLTRISSELGNVIQLRGDKIWKSICGRGQLDVQEILSPEKVWSYCTKRCRFDDLFIYADTRSNQQLPELRETSRRSSLRRRLSSPCR